MLKNLHIYCVNCSINVDFSTILTKYTVVSGDTLSIRCPMCRRILMEINRTNSYFFGGRNLNKDTKVGYLEQGLRILFDKNFGHGGHIYIRDRNSDWCYLSVDFEKDG